MERKIWYAGKEVEYVRDIDSIDEAQSELDAARIRGRAACCLHTGDVHHLYVERKPGQEAWK